VNVFDLFAKIILDTSEYDKGLDDAGEKGKSFISNLGSGLAKAGGMVVKATTAAVAAGSAAVSKITMDAVSAYGDYEQLAGGVETLFGSSANKVMADADKAFKTAGMSANEYMETSIQSAAALINSLGGDQAKAADLMNMSITDMADNVNKMGTSMEGVQNAYRGFSRGNFTMLDNLALGFAGTKEGMQELLDKAQELSGVKYDIGSYADIVEAIHVVQSEMGITGTTAKEAAQTISGSVSSMKSAWANLVAGLGNDTADLNGLIENFFDSVITVSDNVIPVVERVLNGISRAVDKIVPIISKKLPSMIDKILPSLVKAATQLVNALVLSLPSILQILFDQIPVIFDILVPTFLSMLPQVIDLGLQLILALATGISDALPGLVPTIVDIVLQIVDKLTDPDTLMMLIDASVAIIIALAEGLINALPKLIEKAPVIIANLVTAIVEATPKLIGAAIQILVVLAAGIVENLGKLISAGFEIVAAVIVGIVEWLANLVKVGADMGNSIREGFSDFIDAAKTWGKDLMDNFINGIKEKWNNLKESISSVAQTVSDYLGFSEPDKGPLSNFHTYAPDMMELFASGIKDNAKLLTDAVRDTFDIQPVIQKTTNQTTNGAQVSGAGFNGTIVIPVYMGDQYLTEAVVTAEQINDYVTGGRG
jgi:phage-related protein